MPKAAAGKRKTGEKAKRAKKGKFSIHRGLLYLRAFV